MSTPAQIDANRANSTKSTGPRTEEGKARSAANARTHGLTGRDLVILPGQEQEFDDMQTGLYEDIKPEGTLEDELFKALIHAAWSQHRCRRAEADLQKKAATQGLDPLLDPALDPDLKRIDLYARRASGAFHKNMKALRDRQTERHSRLAILGTGPGAPDPNFAGLADLVRVRQARRKEQFQAARALADDNLAEILALEQRRNASYARSGRADAA
jgi:hypothetical protein